MARTVVRKANIIVLRWRKMCHVGHVFRPRNRLAPTFPKTATPTAVGVVTFLLSMMMNLGMLCGFCDSVISLPL